MKRIMNKTVLSLMVVGGCVALSSCSTVNEDYDFDDIDNTIGLSTDGLALPTGSTSEIKVADILELNDGDCVKMNQDGDYVFTAEGASSPTTSKIESIVLADIGATTLPVMLGLNPSDNSVSAAGTVKTVRFSTAKAADVDSLSSITIDNEVTFSFAFSDDLRNAISSFDELTWTFPSNWTFEVEDDVTRNGNTVTFKNIPTSVDFQSKARVTAMDFDGKSLRIDGDEIIIEAEIGMSIKASNVDLTQLAKLVGHKLDANVDMGAVNVLTATGYFNPVIKLEQLGETTINNKPDFLNRSIVDIYNPQIYVTIDNEMSIGSTVTGASIQGISMQGAGSGEQTTVQIPDFKILPGRTTRVCICRNKDALVPNEEVDEIVEVPNLSELMLTFPDKFVFKGGAKADKETEATVEINRPYLITPSYKVMAPIALGQQANLVYEKVFDGWSDDFEDLNLSDATEMVITTDVENTIPAYINVTAVPLFTGYTADIPIEVDVIGQVKASVDGASASSQLKITMKALQPNALKRLDGVKLILSITAKDKDSDKTVEGVTLNGEKHGVTFKNIKARLNGTVIVSE